jgi:hypothetical protein
MKEHGGSKNDHELDRVHETKWGFSLSAVRRDLEVGAWIRGYCLSMLSRQGRITLVQLLASISILALPLALYVPSLRQDSDRWLLAALVAH